MGPKLLSEFDIIQALLFKYDKIDIVSNSWSMRDSGKSVWFTGILSLSAIKAGIAKVIIRNKFTISIFPFLRDFQNIHIIFRGVMAKELFMYSRAGLTSHKGKTVEGILFETAFTQFQFPVATHMAELLLFRNVALA